MHLLETHVVASTDLIEWARMARSLGLIIFQVMHEDFCLNCRRPVLQCQQIADILN